MIFSRDYIGYLARRTVKHLIDAKMITTSDLKVTEARVNEGLVDELSLEDRINEEVRVILDAYSEEMRKSGVSGRKLEARLSESEWLAGPEYSLADICNFAIANSMEVNYAELVNAQDTPHLLAWIRRIQQRPACRQMFANAPGRAPSHAEVMADESKAKVTL